MRATFPVEPSSFPPSPGPRSGSPRARKGAPALAGRRGKVHAVSGVRGLAASLSLAAAASVVHAQAIDISVKGAILPASSGRLSATALAGNWNHATDSIAVAFGSPVTDQQLDWVANVLTGSLGNRSSYCRIGPPDIGIDSQSPWNCVTHTSDSPPWSLGTGPGAASAGGRLRYQTGKTLLDPTPAGQVRFRVLDHFGASISAGGTSAQDVLDEGRAETLANMTYTPPPAHPVPAGIPGPVCTATLVLEIDYGIDGGHRPQAPDFFGSWRWLDLDLHYGASADEGSWGNTAPAGLIRIRAEGEPATNRLGAGWWNGGTVDRSTIHFESNAGRRAPETFSWFNGGKDMSGGSGDFHYWHEKTVRVPLTLPVKTTFELRVLSHQSHRVTRTSQGSTFVPSSPLPGAPLLEGPPIGHGLDVRMYLEDFQPAACKPNDLPQTGSRLPTGDGSWTVVPRLPAPGPSAAAPGVGSSQARPASAAGQPRPAR